MDKFRERITSVQRDRIGDYLPNEKNPKAHPGDQLDKLREILGEYGKAGIALVFEDTDGRWRLFDAHARQKINPDETWWIARTDFTRDEVNDLVIMYDWIAGLSEFVGPVLDGLIDEFSSLSPLLDSMIADIADDAGLYQTGDGPGGSGEDVESVKPADPRLAELAKLGEKWGTCPGQLWRFPSRDGKSDHMVICGDCRDPLIIKRLIGDRVPDIEIHDPPYGINLDTNWKSAKNSDKFSKEKGTYGGREYLKVFGDDEAYDPGFLFNREKMPPELFLWGFDYYAERIPDRLTGGVIVWDKRVDENLDNMFGSSFELCWSMRPHKRDIIRVKWAWIYGTEKEPGKSRYHPTQKPVELYKWILSKYGIVGGITADFYLGGGSHLLAAEMLGMYCFGAEISPGYVAVTLQRYADTFGIDPVLVEPGDVPGYVGIQ